MLENESQYTYTAEITDFLKFLNTQVAVNCNVLSNSIKHAEGFTYIYMGNSTHRSLHCNSLRLVISIVQEFYLPVYQREYVRLIGYHVNYTKHMIED